MENKPFFVRFVVVLISLALFIVSAAGIALVHRTYVAQNDSPTQGSFYDHLSESAQDYLANF